MAQRRSKRSGVARPERTSAPAPSVAAHWTPLSLGLLAPLLILTAALTLGYLWNEDFWWYLSSGEAILKHGGIPHADPLLFTSEGASHWVYHSWLWTVVVALLERAAGIPGVMVFGALLVGAIVTLVYTTAPVDRFGLTNALLTAGVLAAGHQRLCLKAELATWLLLIVYCRFLESDRALDWRRGAILIGLQVLWANLHGGYVLGIFAVGAYAAGSWIARRAHRADASAPAADDARQLLRLTPLLLVASLVQPSLFRGQLELLASLLGSAAARLTGGGGDPLVLEWQPVFPSGEASVQVAWMLLLLVGLASFSGVRGPRRWSRLLLLLGLAALAATAVRHITGLAIGTAFVTIANLGDRRATSRPRSRQAGKARRAIHAAAAGALAAFLLLAAAGLWLGRSDFDNGSARDTFFTVNPRAACPGAADYLLRARPPGPVFNDFATGGYLAWRLYPTYRFFIDSRILEPALVSEYKRILTSPAAWESAQSRYGFRTVVLGNFSQTLRSPLGDALRRDPRWRLVFLDPQAAVFVRDDQPTATPAGPIAAATERVPFLAPQRSGLAALAHGASYPFLRQDAGLYLTEYLATLGSFGKSAAVEEVASAGLRENPASPLLLRQRCAARFALGNSAGATTDCAEAYRLKDDDAGILSLYALVLAKQGKTEEARRLLERARALAPDDPQVARAAAIVH